MKKQRWYDKHEKLANHLEKLKIMPPKQRNELLKDLITFGRLLDPDLFEKHLLEYPLDLKKRRWYDDDPYLWVVVNGLKFASDEILKKVVAFFDKQTEKVDKKNKVETKGKKCCSSKKRNQKEKTLVKSH
ncbi:MAG: hypothetical protein N2053_05460 [Chitinispirillaceae bacterium]|nr:hypothetical protein [Chitinispirillaceae bacterium]